MTAGEKPTLSAAVEDRMAHAVPTAPYADDTALGGLGPAQHNITLTPRELGALCAK